MASKDTYNALSENHIHDKNYLKVVITETHFVESTSFNFVSTCMTSRNGVYKQTQFLQNTRFG